MAKSFFQYCDTPFEINMLLSNNLYFTPNSFIDQA